MGRWETLKVAWEPSGRLAARLNFEARLPLLGQSRDSTLAHLPNIGHLLHNAMAKSKISTFYYMPVRRRVRAIKRTYLIMRLAHIKHRYSIQADASLETPKVYSDKHSDKNYRNSKNKKETCASTKRR